MAIATGEIGVVTTILEAAATAVGAEILLGSFVMGSVGLLRNWSRREFERRALRDGYLGGVCACGFVLVDLLMRYFV
jgi:hypothetical protein